LLLTNLNGAGGFVINSSAFTNTLTITSNSTFSGIIAGKIGVLVNGGTLRLNGVNTYSNGTIVAANAGLAIGSGAANAGTAGIIASNNTTISMPNTGSSSSAPANAVTTVDGATVTFTSATTANNWAGQFNGSALATDIFANGNMSIGGALSFSNFFGTVIITNTTTTGLRWFNAAAGGDNTIFDILGTGGCYARDAVDVVHLGALFGNGPITGPSVSFPATYVIGGLGIDSEFSGAISGSNNITKIGPGRLTLDGAPFTLNTDNTTFTNIIYSGSDITYINTTTVSNGVLALSVPNDLTASPNIVLAATNAVLDTLNMGYVTNFNDINFNSDTALVTNGTMTVVATTSVGFVPQVLGGIGVVRGNGVFNYGTINPGFTNSGGTLTISNALTIEAGAFSAFDISDDPSGLVNPGDILNVEGSVTLSGGSTVALNALNGTLNPGKYRLIKYSGSLINEGGVVPPGPISNFTLGGNVPATSRATLVLSNAPGEVDLVLVSLNTTNLVWQGDGASNFWDVATSFNWTNTSGVPFQFFQQDNVTFNSSSTNPLVTLQGTVAPGSILITGATNYIFAGPGNISGDGGLAMSGTGSLLLTNGANNYAGGTVINSGVLRDGLESGGNENDLALGIGPVTVNTSGELRFGGNSGGVVNHFITNNIVVNGGLVKAYDGAQHLTNSTVTINAGGGTFETVFSTKNIVLDSPLNGAGSLTVASGTNVAAGQIILDYGTNNFSGPLTIATNGNVALVGLAGISNSPTIDVQFGGILDVSGRSNLAWSVTSGQTLKGNGTLRGKFITASAGSIVAPGITGAIGTLTVTNQGNTTNFAVVTLAGTLSMDINRASTLNADRILNVNGTNAMGGTLTVNNLGAALVAGDSFQLLVGNTNTGAFATLNLPALSSGLAWNNTLAANGKLTVVASVIVPTIPPGITGFSLSGANVVISGTNGQAGGTYYLLTTTNLAIPRPQWHAIATNVVGTANFTFIGTNAVKANSGQQFYTLSSTNSNP
jgi:autotransporter-associated beta strand protein